MKKALILSGGGGRGAYQVGAQKAFEEYGIKPDIICLIIGTNFNAVGGNRCYLSRHFHNLQSIKTKHEMSLLI